MDTNVTEQYEVMDDSPGYWAELAGGVARRWVSVFEVLAGEVVFSGVPDGWYPYVTIGPWVLNLEDGEGVSLAGSEDGHNLTIGYQVVP